MPVIYHYRPPPPPSADHDSSSSDSDTEQPAPTDADDSIVLSDLVRTGEASRLRRRGAMRLEHGLAGTTSAFNTHLPNSLRSRSPPSPLPIILRSSTPDNEGLWNEDGGYSPYSRPRMNAEVSRRSRTRSRRDSVGEVYGYTLFCGGEVVESDSGDTSPVPYQPSTLPLYPPPTSSAYYISNSTRRPPKRSNNGCGALVHTHASPRRRLGVWTAESAATGVVVDMDPSYFDRSAVVKIVKSACGCIREGVGCAVCGNPLGTRYKPCGIAAEGLFSSSRRPLPPPPCLENPRYWQHPTSTTSPSSSSRASSQNFFVYTFFSTAVSSSPQFQFPPPPPSPPHHSQSSLLDPENRMLDRGVFTASPLAFSSDETLDEDDEDESDDDDETTTTEVGIGRAPAGTIAVLDPDGMVIDPSTDPPPVPNSPDKTWSEMLLFPER